MSLVHTIKPKRPLDISKLTPFVSEIDNAKFQDRGQRIYYYWIEGKSTRGFDITLEQEDIEIRNTALSNVHDYELTNKVVSEILKLTDGILLNENEERIETLPLFSNEKIDETTIDDCKLIQVLSEEHEITFYGPKRKIHFGKRVHHSFCHLNAQQLRESMFALMQKVNNKLPDFEQGSILKTGNTEENTKILKLLTNEADYIIDKYDYILLQTSEDKPIMITNEILNTMLPPNWTLVDEFTVVAPITSKTEWQNLLKAARPFDQFDTFNA